MKDSCFCTISSNFGNVILNGVKTRLLNINEKKNFEGIIDVKGVLQKGKQAHMKKNNFYNKHDDRHNVPNMCRYILKAQEEKGFVLPKSYFDVYNISYI